MTAQNTNDIITLDTFNELLEVVLEKIQSATTFHPDTILALSTGGFPIAAVLAKRLNIPSRYVVGLPVYKDETGDYHLDDQLVALGDYTNRTVLVVDEASNRGMLTVKAVDSVVQHGGIAKSCVLLAWDGGIQPNFVAETCPTKPPKFYWEQS